MNGAVQRRRFVTEDNCSGTLPPTSLCLISFSIVTIIKAGDICQGFMEGLGVYVGESQVIDWLIAGETFIPHSDRFKFREVEILSVSEIRPPSLQLRVDGGK
ncbi:hypothetical protein MJO28_008386 [Puccinia striiformis f. sp. tritici]|nr:hypothetical protein MJO28_008386 [Puccinia striiformis f. sp. tritici]KNE99032.1 hypothetical protein PSTG_07683 [Puccinia striiformis f. sp. tritici PST-78]POW00170.1 hypothetical protein PSHT_13212 [Puccinia striiformis]